MKFTLEIEIGSGMSPHEIPTALRKAADHIDKLAVKATSQVLIANLEEGPFVINDSGGSVRGSYGVAGSSAGAVNAQEQARMRRRNARTIGL